MSDYQLFLVGATHRSASFSFREKIALGTEVEAALAIELKKAGLREYVILNTCNRVEIYAVGNRASAERNVVTILCGLRQVSRSDFDQFGFVLRDRATVEHLCQVAAGLDSQILGETEIFGQAKRAYATAQARGSPGPILNRLFQKAFQVAKHIRANTGITTGQVSVANVAVDLAQNVFGPLSEAQLLIIGAGEMAEKSAKAFQSRGVKKVSVTNRHLDRAQGLAHSMPAAGVTNRRGVKKVSVTNRHLDRAQGLAHSMQAAVVPFEHRNEAISSADIVVCSTAFPGTLVSVAAVRDSRRRQRSRPVLLIDLAMPRNIEATAGNLENVYLYNLDDLALVAAKNREARLAEAEAGRCTVTQRSDSLWLQLQLQLVTLSEERSPGPTLTEPIFSYLEPFKLAPSTLSSGEAHRATECFACGILHSP